MSQVWQLQDAKNKFSAVVERALSNGPQVITRHGTEVAVLISWAEYRRLTMGQQKLSDFFRQSPLARVEIDLERDTSAVRAEPSL